MDKNKAGKAFEMIGDSLSLQFITSVSVWMLLVFHFLF